jgi:hypothetical protein
MAIEAINPIAVTDAQARAIRKMSLRDSKHSTNEFAAILLGRVVVNTFKPMVKSIAEDAAKKYDMATAGGFECELTREEYVKRAATEYRDILAELES